MTTSKKEAPDFREVREVREVVRHWVRKVLDQRRSPRLERPQVNVAFAATNVVDEILDKDERVLDRFPLSSVESAAGARLAIEAKWAERLKGVADLAPKLLDDLVLDVFEVLPPFTEGEAWALIGPLNPELTRGELFRPDNPRVPGYLRSLAASSADEFRQIVRTQITEGEEG